MLFFVNGSGYCHPYTRTASTRGSRTRVHAKARTSNLDRMHDQPDFFAAPTYDISSVLDGAYQGQRVCLIGCGRKKSEEKSNARSLYVSDRFKAALSLAERYCDDAFAVSAKHGLLKLDQAVPPYDLSIDQLDKGSVADWANGVIDKLEKAFPNGAQILLLMENSYSNPLTATIEARNSSLKPVEPLRNVEERFHTDWHQQALVYLTRVEHLRLLYKGIETLRSLGRTFLLTDLAKQELPNQGLYIFIDQNEINRWNKPGRIVRIGTHAVSTGSRSVLRTRLRNHLGNQDGSGNHRGSIFRLHIGASLLARNSFEMRADHWGKPDDASRSIKASEDWLEKMVSYYIGGLEVAVIEIEDEASKNSLRAKAERQLIALLTESWLPLERPSQDWLGYSSDREAIVRSGIWNVMEVAKSYSPDSQGSVPHLAKLMNMDRGRA